MPIITMGQASKLPYAPNRSYFTNRKKRQPLPDYFVEVDGKTKINTDTLDWKNLIEERKANDLKGTQRGVRNDLEKNKIYDSHGEINTDTASTDDEMTELIEKSQKAKILEPILKAELQQHKIEMNKLEMQREAGALIEYRLSEFLFLGYLEKLNLENLKLFDKLEPMIKNLCKENKPKELIKLLKREQENILVEIKRAQKEDVKKWREEK